MRLTSPPVLVALFIAGCCTTTSSDPDDSSGCVSEDVVDDDDPWWEEPEPEEPEVPDVGCTSTCVDGARCWAEDVVDRSFSIDGGPAAVLRGTAFPGGLCAEACGDDGSCPGDDVCVASVRVGRAELRGPTGPTGVCRRACDSEGDCREGYACNLAIGACVEACENDAQCAFATVDDDGDGDPDRVVYEGEGRWQCGASGLCEPWRPGDACVDDADCLLGTCELGELASTCVVSCDDDTTCPDAMICEQGQCADPCVVSALPSFGGDAGVDQPDAGEAVDGSDAGDAIDGGDSMGGGDAIDAGSSELDPDASVDVIDAGLDLDAGAPPTGCPATHSCVATAADDDGVAGYCTPGNFAGGVLALGELCDAHSECESPYGLARCRAVGGEPPRCVLEGCDPSADLFPGVDVAGDLCDEAAGLVCDPESHVCALASSWSTDAGVEQDASVEDAGIDPDAGDPDAGAEQDAGVEAP